MSKTQVTADAICIHHAHMA